MEQPLEFIAFSRAKGAHQPPQPDPGRLSAIDVVFGHDRLRRENPFQPLDLIPSIFPRGGERESAPHHCARIGSHVDCDAADQIAVSAIWPRLDINNINC